MFSLPIPPLPIPGMMNTSFSVPVGTVVAFAGQVSSSALNSPQNYTTNIEQLGWMLCDGKPRKVSEYPELFAVLGYLYGGKDDIFNVPDYRGLFLRGVDGGANNDPDVIQRKPAKGGTSDGVGSLQTDALQTHEHEYNLLASTTGGAQGKAAMIVDGTNNRTGQPIDGRTSTETRPKNIYVNYIIKYTNA